MSVDLAQRPERYCGGQLRLAGTDAAHARPRHRVRPDGGAAGLGRLTAEKDVDPGEWFFKAHFFQDPVQPGSLGIEAHVQLLQFYMLERGAGAGMANPRFELLTDKQPLAWKYRGQVIPSHGTISTEMEITEFGEDEHGRYALAKAWLWVDGRRIYSSMDVGVRVRDGGPGAEEVLDASGWLGDHRPTWTVPVLPMMSVLDRLAGVVGGAAPSLTEVELRRWIPLTSPARLKTEVDGDRVTLLAWREARIAALSRFEPVATARIGTSGPRPAPFPALTQAVPVTDFYTSGALFHGPAFQYLTSLHRGQTGATGILDAAKGVVPRGNLHQGLLDAATHVIPHDRFWEWSTEIPRGVVAYPHRISRFEQFEPLPDVGEIKVEARFAGFDNEDRRFPTVDLQLIAQGRVLVAMRLVEVLMPTGAFGSADPAQRRAFLRDRVYADGIGLSRTENGVTRLSSADVHQCDWLAGTVAAAYGLPAGARGVDHLVEIAVKDHVARQTRVHPSAVDATVAAVRVTEDPEGVTVR